MEKEFDLCGYCCEWISTVSGKSPVDIADTYPRMMRKVLKHRFGFGKSSAKEFIRSACYGNWTRLHETDMEKVASASDYANYLLDEVFYCSDRWSWDRVFRVQWIYRRLLDRIDRLEV